MVGEGDAFGVACGAGGELDVDGVFEGEGLFAGEHVREGEGGGWLEDILIKVEHTRVLSVTKKNAVL